MSVVISTEIISLLGIPMHIRCLTLSTLEVQSDKMAKRGQRQHCAVLHLSHSWVSERSKCYVQVVSFHCYHAIFHPIIEQFTVFYISGLVF